MSRLLLIALAVLLLLVVGAGVLMFVDVKAPVKTIEVPVAADKLGTN